MTYDIISCPTQSLMRQRVNEAIERGAVCQGSPFFDSQNGTWCQAVVKKPEPDQDAVKLREPARKR